MDKKPRASDFRLFLPKFRKNLQQILLHTVDGMNVFAKARNAERANVFVTLIIANCPRRGRETGILIFDT